MKYSEANHVIIQLTRTPEVYNFTIEDDGFGFTMNNNIMKKGLGLKSIKYRIDYLNGDINIDTSPGNGTCYDIIFPVQ